MAAPHVQSCMHKVANVICIIIIIILGQTTSHLSYQSHSV